MQIIILFVFFATFTVSLAAELIFHKQACTLCLITRYLHLLISCICIFSLIHNKTSIRLVLFFILFFAVCFAFYHLGVENHWWSGPAHCTKDLLPTIDAIENKLLDVRCDAVNWKIFGISSTLYNFCITCKMFWFLTIAFALGYKKDVGQQI